MPKSSLLTLRTFYFSTWWALVCFALLNAFFSGICPPFLVVSTFVLCIPSLLPRWSHPPRREVGWVMNGYLVALLLAAGITFRTSHNIVDFIGFGLCGFLPFTLWRNRDSGGNWRALLAVFLVSQVSLLVGEEAIEFVLFILFALAFVFNLNSAHLYFHLGAFESRRTTLPRNYFPTFFYSTALGVALALGLFFLFPRSIQWVNPFGMRAKDRTTGYTGTISLDGKNLRESKEVVMRVESNDLRWLANSGPNLYFRGNTVENFDGLQWRRSHSRVYHYKNPLALRFVHSRDSKGHLLKIFREPVAGDWVFYPGVLRDILGPYSFSSQLQYDDSGNLSHNSAEPERYYYDLLISMARPPDNLLDTTRVDQIEKEIRLNASDYDEPNELGEDPERYLRMPNSVRNQSYFTHWVQEVGMKSNRATITEVMMALTREFHSRYTSTYEHEMPSVGSFEYFLSKGRAGHCEYFATAAAMFFRNLGIPTRVVLGYRAATFNEVSRVLEVRESSAHAWVEIFIPGYGWSGYDPTPMKIELNRAGLWDYVTIYSSAAKFWFIRYVVQYNSETQHQLAKQLFTFGKSKSGSESHYWHWAKNRTLWLVLGGCLLVFQLLRRQKRRKRRRRASDLPDYYRSFRRRMRAKGFERKAGETFAHFHSRLRKNGVDEATIIPIDQALEKELYAGNPANPTLRKKLRRLIRSA